MSLPAAMAAVAAGGGGVFPPGVRARAFQNGEDFISPDGDIAPSKQGLLLGNETRDDLEERNSLARTSYLLCWLTG